MTRNFSDYLRFVLSWATPVIAGVSSVWSQGHAAAPATGLNMLAKVVPEPLTLKSQIRSMGRISTQLTGAIRATEATQVTAATIHRPTVRHLPRRRRRLRRHLRRLPRLSSRP